jgi:hypothetical protein
MLQPRRNEANLVVEAKLGLHFGKRTLHGGRRQIPEEPEMYMVPARRTMAIARQNGGLWTNYLTRPALPSRPDGSG